MSAAAQQVVGELVDELGRFLRDYYHEDIAELAQRYPNEQHHLTVDWGDLYRFNTDIAEDYLDAPGRLDDHFEAALSEYDLPIPESLDDVDVRMVGLHETDVYSPIEVTKQGDDIGYIGVRGDLAKVTTPAREVQEQAFECQRCGSLTYIPQRTPKLQEPHECSGCERQGPFTKDHAESTFEHFCKVRIETPPDERGDLQSQHIDGFVRGDLVWDGHEQYGLVARSGDSVTVYGTVVKQPKEKHSRLYDEFLDVRAIEFDTDDDAVDIAAHRERFEALASREDAIDVFAESIAPELYATPAWEVGLELLVAYLFGAPRIDVDQGPTYRGDIHALFVSDYGMGKSLVKEALAQFSPQCIKESVTGMSSDVGLLAAAVKDDFGNDQWTLKPGILVRANGGHVILDEIDKTDADLARMNDALEGEQVVDVNKAGQHATYNSRVGLLALGNPKQSRFDPSLAISEQLGIDQSLLSRFDGIVTMTDEPDAELDAKVAETAGLAMVEAQEYEFADREELDRLDREVGPDVGRVWVAYAREHVHPVLSAELFQKIRTWYAEDARQLNKQFGNDEGGGQMPVPVTPRAVPAAVRFAVAFARANLRDRVAEADVDRAIELSKALIGQTFNGRNFQPQQTRPRSQDERINQIRAIVRREQEEWDRGVPIGEVLELAKEMNMGTTKVESRIDKMLRKGELYEPKNGHVRVPE